MLAINGYGFALVVPVALSVVAMAGMKFGLLAALLPLATLVGSAFFLPFGLGNSLVRRVVLRNTPEAAMHRPDGFIAQVTFVPRLRTGLRGSLEDADDVGLLDLSRDLVLFKGDSVQLSVPVERVLSVEGRNIGMRGLFAYGSVAIVRIEGLAGVEEVHFADRSALLLPGARAASRRLLESLERFVERARKSAGPVQEG